MLKPRMQAVVLVMCLAVLITAAPPATAALYSVTSGEDLPDTNPGDGICESGFGCTLRAAVQEANAIAGPDTIIVTNSASPCQLTFGPVALTDNSTHVIGDGSLPQIDGLNNFYEAASLVVSADGCRISGLWFRRSRGDAVRIEGGNNVIGGPEPTDRVVFTANGLDGNTSAAVHLSGGDAHLNQIHNCFVGVYGNGMTTDGNALGVVVSGGAYNNLIGDTLTGPGCVISGNNGFGIWITDKAYGTIVSNCLIGVRADGVSPAENGSDGVRIDGGARKNRVGSDDPSVRNVISCNAGSGVTIEGVLAEQNRILGCYIGLDITGLVTLGNRGNGVVIAGARGNIVGGDASYQRNLISANDASGVLISGANARDNIVTGNYIGLDPDGRRSFGNGRVSGHGVMITDGASHNTIGSGVMGNTISGQPSFGILIENAHFNDVIGNQIGCNPAATYSIPNGAGVVLQGGSSGNIIGGNSPDQRNILSGNWGDIFPLGCGVILLDAGTTENAIQGNFIGTDSSGARSVPNRESGVLIGAGASHNLIGGSLPGQGNVISGNGFGTLLPDLGRGIHVFGPGTLSNRIEGNIIGASADTTIVVRNYGHGVSILAGAEGTRVGGDSPDHGNIIAGNIRQAIYIKDQPTRFTTFRFNRMSNNDPPGITILDEAQEGIEPPRLIAATLTTVEGELGPPGGLVDFYTSNTPDEEKAEGIANRYVGTAEVDLTGQFTGELFGVVFGDTITAIATDHRGNSSMFAAPISIGTLTDVGDDLPELPTAFTLSQNYPNPFNPATTIQYSLPTSSIVRLEILNVLGRRVQTLVNTRQSAGSYSVDWDGRTQDGHRTASGVYFYQLSTESQTATRKMILLQ